jgi:hypothetical protein
MLLRTYFGFPRIDDVPTPGERPGQNPDPEISGFPDDSALPNLLQWCNYQLGNSPLADIGLCHSRWATPTIDNYHL